jgi:hypothetical protein
MLWKYISFTQVAEPVLERFRCLFRIEPHVEVYNIYHTITLGRTARINKGET